MSTIAVVLHDNLAERQRRADQLVRDKRDERDRKLTELGNARRRNPFRDWRPSSQLSSTLAEIGERTGLDTLDAQADGLQQTLASTGETLRRAGPVLGALRSGGWRYTVALLVVIGLGPLCSFLLSRLDVSAVSNVIGSVSALLAGFTAYAARGGRLLTDTLGKICQAQAELNAELDALRAELNQEIREAETSLADTQRELTAAVDAEHQLAASVADLEAQLARITPSSVLAEFLDDRFASDDYRRHLGLPALVRQDLERLSRLIQQRHDAGAASPGHDGDSANLINEKHAIDRVVLYIDDLDRCPTHVVIKVLEAVHLLLAFPLFVVVVAVDARWLESSLREHYTQLQADPTVRSDTAVPSDYLEKIFQVPFWVRPISADIRRDMVRGLLMPNLSESELYLADQNSAEPNLENLNDLVAGGDDALVTGLDLFGADRTEFVRLVESFSVTDPAEQPWLEAAELTVTRPELGQIEDVSSLINATPRAVKRFVNVYLLLKSMGRNRGWPLPDQGQLAVLLAISTGLPKLADELFTNLTATRPGAEEPLTLRTALPSTTVQNAAGTQLARLTTWLDENPVWRDVPLAGMDRWAELILRFRFDRVPPVD